MNYHSYLKSYYFDMIALRRVGFCGAMGRKQITRKEALNIIDESYVDARLWIDSQYSSGAFSSRVRNNLVNKLIVLRSDVVDGIQCLPVRLERN